MRTLKPLVAVFLLLAAVTTAVLVPGDGADAGGAESSGWGTITDGSPEAVVIVAQSGTFASWSGTRRGGARWTCGYYTVDALQTSPLDFVLAVRWFDGPVVPVAGFFYVLACDDEAGNRVRSTYLQYNPGDPFGGVAAVERTVEEARRRIELEPPVLAMNPSPTQLAGIPTWFWISEGWNDRWATASIGAVSTTVHARPFGVLWDFGDGTRMICDRGVAYDVWRLPRDQSSSCTHAYERTTVGEPFGSVLITATLYWAIDWWSSGGESGTLGTLSRSSTVATRVIEAQALVR